MFRSAALALASLLTCGSACAQTAPVPSAVSELIERWVTEAPSGGDRLRPQRVECAGTGSAAVCLLVYGPGAGVTATLIGDRVRNISVIIGAPSTPSEAARDALYAALMAHRIDIDEWPNLTRDLFACLRGAELPQTVPRFRFGWGIQGQTRRQNESERRVMIDIEGTPRGCLVTLVGEAARLP